MRTGEPSGPARSETPPARWKPPACTPAAARVRAGPGQEGRGRQPAAGASRSSDQKPEEASTAPGAVSPPATYATAPAAAPQALARGTGRGGRQRTARRAPSQFNRKASGWCRAESLPPTHSTPRSVSMDTPYARGAGNTPARIHAPVGEASA